MTEKIQKIVNNIVERDFESFKKNLFLVVSEKIEEALEERRLEVSSSILEADDPAAAAAEADAEKQALFVDPMMAKEYFLKDIDYKGHTITLKTLGTGIGKPIISYIDAQQFEVFTDKEIAEKESKQAIDRLIEKGITDIKNLRKTPEQLKMEAEKTKQIQKSKESEDKESKKEK
jgi:hypothetical protein